MLSTSVSLHAIQCLAEVCQVSALSIFFILPRIMGKIRCCSVFRILHYQYRYIFASLSEKQLNYTKQISE